MCGKLAFLNACKSDCICDAAATEELRSEVRLRSFAAHSINQRLYQGYLINFNQISCMQFSRYKSFWLNFYQSSETSNRSLNLLITGKTSYHNSSSRLIRVSTGLDQFISGSILFPTGLTFQCLFYLYQASSLLFSFLIWRPPALPHRLQCSTIGRLRLNRRVRDGNGCFPQAHRHQK